MDIQVVTKQIQRHFFLRYTTLGDTSRKNCRSNLARTQSMTATLTIQHLVAINILPDTIYVFTGHLFMLIATRTPAHSIRSLRKPPSLQMKSKYSMNQL